ncbi:hypothetical protein D3C76_1048290 [compost metagenome]
MASAVDQHVDAAPLFHHGIDQAFQVFNRLVAAGYANAAKLGRQCFALARRGKDANLEAVSGQASCCRRTHAAATGCDNRNFFY